MHRKHLAVLACMMMAGPVQAHPSTQGQSGVTDPSVEHHPGKELPESVVVDEVQVSQMNEILDAQPHGAGPSKDDWLRLAASDSSQRALVKVLLNPKELLIRRQRALSGLSFFPTAEHKTVVLNILQGKESYRLKGSAAGAFARMAGKDAVEPLSLLLVSEKPRLREAIVKALISIDGQSAKDVLSKHLQKETKSYIKNSIRAALEVQPQRVGSEEAEGQ